MHHSTVDQYAKESSFYRLNPRAKTVAIMVFVVIVALLRDALTLALSLTFIISMIVISSVPLHHIAERYIVALPFVVFATLGIYVSNDLTASISMFIRISSCVLGLLLLSSTTPFFDLLKGIQSLKVPRIFIVLLMFTYRYLFVLIEEMQRMRLARKAKGFQGGRHLLDKRSMKTISYTAGMVLIRAYERGVRIYDALLVRGYDGKIKTLRPSRFTGVDLGFCSVFVSMAVLLICCDRMVIL